MKVICIILILALLNGCATIIGPYVSQEEIIRAHEELRVKALGYELKQLTKINNIGYRLISCLPKEDLRRGPEPYLGIYVFNIDKYFKRLYNLRQQNGVVVGVVIDGSPSQEAGIIPGDVILRIDNNQIKNVSDFYTLNRKFEIGQIHRFRIYRSGMRESLSLKIGSIPIDIPIVMVDIQEVNAAARSDGIFITYGLVQFANSDDEIAAVLGHELAHIVRGHVAKATGLRIVSALAAIAIGIAAENASPGSGSAVVRGVGGMADIFNASYTRDLEREADYFSTKYVYLAGFNVEACATVEERFAIEIPRSMIRNYLSTHPSSPERLLRIKKAIAELKSQNQSSS